VFAYITDFCFLFVNFWSLLEFIWYWFTFAFNSIVFKLQLLAQKVRIFIWAVQASWFEEPVGTRLPGQKDSSWLVIHCGELKIGWESSVCFLNLGWDFLCRRYPLIAVRSRFQSRWDSFPRLRWDKVWDSLSPNRIISWIWVGTFCVCCVISPSLRWDQVFKVGEIPFPSVRQGLRLSLSRNKRVCFQKLCVFLEFGLGLSVIGDLRVGWIIKFSQIPQFLEFGLGLPARYNSNIPWLRWEFQLKEIPFSFYSILDFNLRRLHQTRGSSTGQEIIHNK
jgi:hypothetical protein